MMLQKYLLILLSVSVPVLASENTQKNGESHLFKAAVALHEYYTGVDYNLVREYKRRMGPAATLSTAAQDTVNKRVPLGKQLFKALPTDQVLNFKTSDINWSGWSSQKTDNTVITIQPRMTHEKHYNPHILCTYQARNGDKTIDGFSVFVPAEGRPHSPVPLPKLPTIKTEKMDTSS